MAHHECAGGALQVLAQWPSLRAEGFRYRPTLDLRDPALHQVLEVLVEGHHAGVLAQRIEIDHLVGAVLVFLIEPAHQHEGVVVGRRDPVRARIDQVLYACVKVLLPMACVLLLGAAVWQWLMHCSSSVEGFLEAVIVSGLCGNWNQWFLP